MQNKTIEIENLCYTYPDGTQALNNLTLTLSLSERTAILGANGSGKSTLLYHLNALIVPQCGSVRIGGQEVTKATADEIRKTVGLLFDNPDNQLFSPTVFDDICFGPLNLKIDKAEASARAKDTMAAVGISHLADKSPYNLSLGQKKRCAIAGILAMRPEIIIMDEPFSGLDPMSLKQFLKILQELSSQGTAQIISTHDVDLAYAWADRVILLSEGRLLCSGGREVLQNRELVEEAGLMLPYLVEIFAGCGSVPISNREANLYVKMLEG